MGKTVIESNDTLKPCFWRKEQWLKLKYYSSFIISKVERHLSKALNMWDSVFWHCASSVHPTGTNHRSTFTKTFCGVYRMMYSKIILWNGMLEIWFSVTAMLLSLLLFVQEFLSIITWLVSPALPKSSNIAWYNFFIFPKLKLIMKGNRFDGTVIKEKLQGTI